MSQRLTVVVNHARSHRLDLQGSHLAAIRIDFVRFQYSFPGARQFLENRIKNLAGEAPWSRERDQHRLFGLLNLRLGIRFPKLPNWRDVFVCAHFFASVQYHRALRTVCARRPEDVYCIQREDFARRLAGFCWLRKIERLKKP